MVMRVRTKRKPLFFALLIALAINVSSIAWLFLTDHPFKIVPLKKPSPKTTVSRATWFGSPQKIKALAPKPIPQKATPPVAQQKTQEQKKYIPKAEQKKETPVTENPKLKKNKEKVKTKKLEKTVKKAEKKRKVEKKKETTLYKKGKIPLNISEVLDKIEFTSPILTDSRSEEPPAPKQKPLTFADLLKGFIEKKTTQNNKSTRHNPLAQKHPMQEAISYFVDKKTTYIRRIIIKANSILNQVMRKHPELIAKINPIKYHEFTVKITFNKNAVITGLQIAPLLPERELNEVVQEAIDAMNHSEIISDLQKTNLTEISIPLVFTSKN
jgi:hypothetical protein